jgi:hypothetical protein
MKIDLEDESQHKFLDNAKSLITKAKMYNRLKQ